MVLCMDEILKYGYYFPEEVILAQWGSSFLEFVVFLASFSLLSQPGLDKKVFELYQPF